MGLFGGKDICVICGKKVSGMKNIILRGNKMLCKECSAKVCMNNEILQTMDVEGIKEHFAYREKNKELVKTFKKTNSVEANRRNFYIDNDHRLWWAEGIGTKDNPPIFTFEEVIGIELIEGSVITKKEGETGEEIVSKENGIGSSMQVNVHLNNKYIKRIPINVIPGANLIIPGTMQYMAFRQTGMTVYGFFKGIYDACEHESVSPVKQEPVKEEVPTVEVKPEVVEAAPEAPKSADPVDEIRRYKALMDDSIITEEEFNAKKKQLLGL